MALARPGGQPASFWTYVVTALRAAVPGVGAGALELLASFPLPTELVLTTVVNELAAAPGGVWLVLDDYHVVDSHEVGVGMAFLLEHLPPHVHVVISTRADPDLPLSRWRVRGELVEIRAAELRFTPDEVAAGGTALPAGLLPGRASDRGDEGPGPDRAGQLAVADVLVVASPSRSFSSGSPSRGARTRKPHKQPDRWSGRRRSRCCRRPWSRGRGARQGRGCRSEPQDG